MMYGNTEKFEKIN